MWKHTASWNPKHLNEKHNQSRSANISHDSHDAILLNEFADLWSDAEKLWDQHQESPGFHAYVSADYSAIFTALQQLRNSAVTVLEWGSGLGIATIMASRMGFEAYGIEAEQELLEHSDRLANAYGSTATFAQGSFVPDEFRHQSETHHEQKKTIIDLADAYGKLGLKLDHFDLVYSYPWPNEIDLYKRIMQIHGKQPSVLLTYHVRRGCELTHF